MTVGSLFAGIGGFDLGFEQAGFKTVWQVERNPFCQQVLRRSFPDTEIFTDVEHVGRGNLKPVDIIIGGDPCQRNSNAWRNGTGEESPAHHFIRIVDQLRPRLVLRENPAAVRADAPWPWWRFRTELERLGYAVLPFRLRACCAGADHERERLFLLAALPDTHSKGLEGNERALMAGTDAGGYNTDAARPARRHTAPRICGRTDGIPHRSHRLKALGNAVDVRVARFIAERIREAQ